jgi:hypothetical protein
VSVKVGADSAGFSGNVRLDRKRPDGALDFGKDVVEFLRFPVIVDDFGQPASHLEKLFAVPEVRLVDGRFRLRLQDQIVGHDALDVVVAILAETARRIVRPVDRHGGAYYCAVLAPVDESCQRPWLDRFV